MAVKKYNRIKSVMAEHGTTQEDLAKYLGVTSIQVSRYCRNASQPPIPTLFLIAEYHNVEVADLLVKQPVKKGPSQSEKDRIARGKE